MPIRALLRKIKLRRRERGELRVTGRWNSRTSTPPPKVDARERDSTTTSKFPDPNQPQDSPPSTTLPSSQPATNVASADLELSGASLAGVSGPASVDGRGVASYDGRPLSPSEVNHIKDGPHFSHHEMVMNDVVDKLEVTKSFRPSGDTVEAIKHSIRNLSEGIPILMRALDECGKVHPFVAVVVLAFRAAYALESKRRDNDKKILALFGEMRDMVAVLTQLSTLKDTTTTTTQIPAADGTSADSRLEYLCHQTAADIRSCSNTCDAYNRKRLVVKCLAGPVWEARLGEYVALFTKRREEFLFAMNVRTTIGVEEVGKTVKDIEAVQKEANERMKLLLAAFETLVSPEQKEMQSLINKYGGAVEVKNKDKSLQRLIEESNHLVETGEDTLRPATQAPDLGSITVAGCTPGSTKISAPAVETIRSELTENIDFVLAKNMETFGLKFTIQQKLIVEDMAKVVGREGDRIIAAVTTGAHDRILDPDMHTLWKEMGWKGSVKAMNFALALRDYMFEGKGTRVRKHQGGEEAALWESQDLWPLRYLDLHNLQTISEAIDDDASGFITIEEINSFTTSRPLDWSLIKWLAFWAVGFNMGMVRQRTAIKKMLNEMISLIPCLLPENRSYARKYLHEVWENIVTITRSLEPKWSSELVVTMFKDYVQSEEDRIKRNLIDIKYRIDGVDTLYLTTGPGRIEKHFFPLVKVLLQRHLQIFHIARTKVLHRKELEDAYTCFNHVKSALDYRLCDLKAICASHHNDLPIWLKSFAHGLFEYHNDKSLVWSFDSVIGSENEDNSCDSVESFDDSNFLDILTRGEGHENTVDTSSYVEEPDIQVPPNGADKSDIHPLIGTWHVLLYSDSSAVHPYHSLFTVNFKPAKDQPEDGAFTFEASRVISTGESWCLTGTSRPTEDREKFELRWLLKYNEGFDDEYFIGVLDTSVMIINGTAGPNSDYDVSKRFATVVVSNRPADVVIYRPHPDLLKDSKKKISALWQFARDAIIHQVRKSMWSWSYFEARRNNRKRYLELVMRSNWFDKPLNDEETQEFFSVKRKMFPADVSYLTSLELKLSTIRVHVNRTCDCCKGKLSVDCNICLECKPNSSPFKSIDICSDRGCLTSDITRDDLDSIHEPSHRIFRTRKFLIIRDMGVAWMQALDAIDQGDWAITDALASYEECREGEGSGSEAVGSKSAEDERVREEVDDTSSAPTFTRCYYCSERLESPCWYCIDCTNTVLVCLFCDPSGGFDRGGHEKDHTLLKVRAIVEEEEDTNAESKVIESINALQSKVNGMFEDLQDSWRKDLDSFNGQMKALEDRFSRVEALLEKILHQRVACEE